MTHNAIVSSTSSSKRMFNCMVDKMTGKPHNIKNVKITEELEKLVLELRLNNRFDRPCMNLFPLGIKI